MTGVADRRDGDRDRDHRSVLSDKRCLKVLNNLAILDPGQYVVHLGVSIFGNQEPAGLADDLRSRVAVHLLSGRVPARDHARQRASNKLSNLAVFENMLVPQSSCRRALETGRNLRV